MDLASGITATSHALAIAKSIKNAEKALDSATLKAKLAEIISELADAKIAQAEMVERVKALETENERLLRADTELGELTEQEGYYYRKEDDGLIGWPACPSCLAKEKRVTFLIQNGKFYEARCPRCNSGFSPVPSYVSPGYSRTDERNRKNAESDRKLIEGYDRLNRNSWLAR